MLHLLQAFGGPGRTAVSFAPTYSMYPEYARDTGTRWVVGRREGDFALDPERGARAGAARAAERGAAAVAQQPHRHRAAARRRRGAVRGGRRSPAGAWSWSTRRTPSSVAPAPRARSSCCRRCATWWSPRTMSKAFALRRRAAGVPRRRARDLRRDPRGRGCPTTSVRSTQAAALAALRHADELLARVDDLRDERDATAAWLTEQGLEVAESDANFVLFGRYADRHAVWQGLLDRGVLDPRGRAGTAGCASRSGRRRRWQHSGTH